MSEGISSERPYRVHDLSGQTFGRLTVLSRAPNQKRRTMFLCRCSCGTVKAVWSAALKDGKTRSCGCLSREGRHKHGRAHTREYAVWEAMLARCYNPKCKAFPNYGGRGITVCESWRKSFAAFFADMGECPLGLTLDRLDNNGHYCPENCKWTTRRQQAANRRTSVFIEFNGERMIVSDWARRTGLPRGVIRYRILNGWSAERALTEPLATRSGMR